MVEFGCHYHRIHAQMSMKIISREGLFSYQFTFFGLSQRPSGWRSLLILPCMVIFPSRAGEYAEDLAAGMLAATLGIEFNPELDWDEREDLFKMSGKIVRTINVTQSAVGNKDGLWMTVFAAAVFINEDNLAVEIGKSERDAGSGNNHAPRTYEFSTLINDPGNDSRTCIQPATPNVSPALFS